MADQIVITEKTSQAKDVRAAVGGLAAGQKGKRMRDLPIRMAGVTGVTLAAAAAHNANAPAKFS